MTFKMPFVWSYIELWSYARETYNRKNACLPYLKTKFDFFFFVFRNSNRNNPQTSWSSTFLVSSVEGLWKSPISIHVCEEYWHSNLKRKKILEKIGENTINGDICLKYLFYVIKYKCYNSVTYKLIHACTSVCPTFFSSVQTGQRLINTQNM